MKELDKYYAADRGLLQGQLNTLPGQAEAQIKGLDAKLAQANDNILEGARGRGIGFSGIPIAEQAKYAATEYAPAVAGVRKSQNDQKSSILSALNGLGRDQYSQARSIYDTDRTFAEQRRQFDLDYRLKQQQAAAERAAASSNGAGYYLGQTGGGGSQSGTQAQMSQRKGGGFNFTIGGKSVSAATYAKATNTNFRTLLSQMAKAGDKGAKNALGFVGNDYKYDPRKLNTQNASLYNNLVWGLMPNAKASSKGGGGW